MKKYIEISKAKEHNLKGFDLKIPHNQLVIITGVSGSGKSSLAYDLIFREGQRRYLESMNAYARQFMAKAKHPRVGSVQGIKPTLAIGQRSLQRSPKSTVGTLTGIYDLLRLLMARYGKSKSEFPLSRSLFSFNSSLGACQSCRGLGVIDEISENLLIKNANLSIREGAFEMTTPSGYIVYSQVTLDVLNQVCKAHGFDIDIPWKDLTRAQQEVVLFGSQRLKVPFGKHTLESRLKWSGITARPREEGFYKGIMTIMQDILKRDRNKNILRFARTVTCPDCHGKRLQTHALAVNYQHLNISEFAEMSFCQLADFASTLLQNNQLSSGESILWQNIKKLCQSGIELGLGHLTVDRSSESISAGEGQRLKLLTLAANRMQDMIYVLDEPSIGLHQSEISALVKVLYKLRDQGNTVIVVEHDPLMIKAADFLIDIGYDAGIAGGNLLYAGLMNNYLNSGDQKSATWKALYQKYQPSAKPEISTEDRITISGASARNLKSLNINLIPGCLNVISGVSGAGKTTLIEEVVLPAIEGNNPENYQSISGQNLVNRIIKIDQKPIGRTPRSNAATYTGLMDELRTIFANLESAKNNGLKKSHFSFNTKGGRCEKCEGAGMIKLGMHFLSDISYTCPACNGKRFKPQVLAVKWQNCSIADLLDKSVDQLCNWFPPDTRAGRILHVLNEVGLGYITLGQPATTLSGGEAQRIKLASELARSRKKGTLYYLDEPTTGLQHYDVENLLILLNKLIAEGNTVVVIEHDPQIIRAADWLIDLGPRSGNDGGKLLFEGKINDLVKIADNNTAKALRNEISCFSQPVNNKPYNCLEFKNVCTNSLKNINVKILKNKLNIITGVSGSGKSSLAFDTIYAEGWQRYLDNLPSYSANLLANHQRNQNTSSSSMGATLAVKQEVSRHNPRSTVGTFCGVYDLLRLLFSRFGKGNRLPASEFSFNNHSSACPLCKGLGTILSCNPQLLITDPDKSIFAGAMDGSKRGRYYGEKQGQFLAILKSVEQMGNYDFSKSWNDLSDIEKEIVMFGTGDIEYEVNWEFERGKRQGVHNFSRKWLGFVNLINQEFDRVHQKKAANDLKSLMSQNTCPRCQGKRLKPYVLSVKLWDHDISEISQLELNELINLLKNSIPSTLYSLDDWNSLIKSITDSLKNLCLLGLSYLTLQRRLDTLSGGEYQRLRIARQLISGLTGVTYVFDEISRGLHYTERSQVLILLKKLAEAGNTIICVEHDLDFIKNADHIIELGPGAASHGGALIAEGSIDQIIDNPNSLIRNFLNEDINSPKNKRMSDQWLKIISASANNLKNIDICIPVGMLTGICGVSGSGKSSLCQEVIWHSYQNKKPVNCLDIIGLSQFDQVIFVKQTALNRNALSTPATYLGILKMIAKIICDDLASRNITTTPAIFNYAGKQGQCPECKGTGIKRQDLDFAGSLDTKCDRCDGNRYNDDTLKFTYKNLNIADILNLTVAQAIDFFPDHNKLSATLKIMLNLGLGYLQLGQSTTTLSGGEAQRLLMAAALRKFKKKNKNLIILDEPTSGLHPKDILSLSDFLQNLVNSGQSVVFIEHNQQLLKQADWLIELGEKGGHDGGKLIYSGTPNQR